MFPTEAFRILAACALLSAPPDAPCPDFHPSRLAPLRQAALRLELLDEREYAPQDPMEWPGHVEMLRCRWRDLHAAPHLSECRRFPDAMTCANFCAENRAFRQHLCNRRDLDVLHREEIDAVIEECDQLYRAWDLIRDSRCSYYYMTVRRQALLDLRNLLGLRAFYRGELPPALPVWRLPRVP